MTTFTFAKATKKAAKARIALEGPSGSGKTYTALLTASALGQSIAVIDTEHRSASLYADKFSFDTLALDSYDPQILIGALAAAGQARYDVAVIDSLSHFWMGSDGMLEQVDRAARRTGGGNSFAGWKEMRPIERRMIEAILAYPGHVIVTLRSKTEWVVEENDRGKKVPRKVGLKAEQRDGLEYEFTIVGAMDQDNTLVISKSRFDDMSGAVYSKPGPEFGASLAAWLNDGEATSTASDIRDEVTGAPDASYEDMIQLYRKADRLGLLLAGVVDEDGSTVALGDFIRSKGVDAKAREARADQPAPTVPAQGGDPDAQIAAELAERQAAVGVQA